MEYLFSKRFNTWIQESEPLVYVPCHDGIAIHSGSLLGSGFEPYHLNGITLPEEIEGTPVTELAGSFRQSKIGYIEAAKLKRIHVSIAVDDDLGLCRFPLLCGGEAPESISICFIGEELRVLPIEDSAVRRTITEIVFTGTVLDNPDWDYGSFSSGIFQYCPQLRVIRGRFSGYSMTGSTFEGCTSLTAAPDLNVKQMGDREFLGCTSLNRIHLHNGLTSIGSECFKNCQSLADIYIPDTVKHFGSGIFDGCSRLRSIHLPKYMQEIPSRMFAGCGLLQKVFLSDDIKSIGNEAFSGCASLGRIWFPDHLDSIGEGAFFGCASMREVYLPENLATIGEDAFSNCGPLIIRGKAGTLAEKYAKENGVKFISVE